MAEVQGYRLGYRADYCGGWDLTHSRRAGCASYSVTFFHEIHAALPDNFQLC